MSRFLHKRFDGLKEYVPGEQPQDKSYIKLNTNESPYPPSPKVISAIGQSEISDLRLYSDPECKCLKEKIAQYYGFERENVFVGNGSDECINFFFMAFCGTERGIIFPEISYGFYSVFAELYNLDYTKVSLNEDFTISYADYLEGDKNVVIANPNAPTGISMPLDDIEKIVASNHDRAVLIDEAYVDFGGESAIDLVKKYDNLLVVRTFSKSRSLAGARLGYAIGSKEIIKDLEKIKYSTNPYNVNRLTLLAGEAAIEDDGYFRETTEKTVKARTYTECELERLGFFVLPSSANFVFAKSDRISGADYYERLKECGILIRHFSDKKICEYNRITIGTLEQMETLINVTKEILKEVQK